MLLWAWGAALAIQGAAPPCDCAGALLYGSNAGSSQIAADEAFVYFGDNHGKIEKMSKLGGPVATVATFPGDRVITGLAVGATNIYFGVVGSLAQFAYTANIGTIAAVSKNGGTITTLTTTATTFVPAHFIPSSPRPPAGPTKCKPRPTCAFGRRSRAERPQQATFLSRIQPPPRPRAAFIASNSNEANRSL